MDKEFYTKELINEVLKECMVTTIEEDEEDEEDNRDEN